MMGGSASRGKRAHRRRAWIGVAAVTAMTATTVIVGALAVNRPVLAQSVNINEIFWCEGKPIGDQTPEQCAKTRDLILSACTSCHVFTPIVIAQKTEEQWDSFLDAHRGRVSEMSDADYAELRTFLKAHFNPENPVPKLPPALMNYTLPAA